MSIIAIIIWLLLEGFALTLVNLFAWRQLAAWFSGEGKPNTFAFTLARLSILLTLNAWLTASILISAGRSVWMGPEMAGIHWMMTWGQGGAMLFAGFIISLLTPFVVIGALGCGAAAVMLARRGSDKRSVWLGGTGMGLNGLLLLAFCGCCGSRFLPRRTRPKQPTSPIVVENETHAGNYRYRGKFPRWNRADQVEAFAAKYVERGFSQIVDQSIIQRNDLTKPTIIFSTSVVLPCQADSHVVLVAQTAIVRGEIQGDLEFFGQVLQIEEDAVIHGDLHIHGAQTVMITGVVNGEITGDYENLNDFRD